MFCGDTRWVVRKHHHESEDKGGGQYVYGSKSGVGLDYSEFLKRTTNNAEIPIKRARIRNAGFTS